MRGTILDVIAGRATWAILAGDCAVRVREIPDASVDSIVADPPAGIAFMGRAWDTDKGGKEHWIEWLAGILREAFRVLKPGGRMVLWALPQTSHWTAEAGERAGFLLTSKVLHLFGSGFPKSTNVSKQIDSAAGATREIVGVGQYAERANKTPKAMAPGGGERSAVDDRAVTAPATPEARQWEGHGSALKPAAEEWIFFQKPFAAVTSDTLRAVTGWDHWVSTRRLDTGKQRAKAATKYGVTIPEGGELQARNMKALHPGVPMREELRWRAAAFTEAAPAPDAEGDEEAERVYSSVGEWQILWSKGAPYKPWKNASIAANVLAHGTGGLNIDAARVGTGGGTAKGSFPNESSVLAYGNGLNGACDIVDIGKGRFPANLVLSHTAWEETHCPCGAVLSFIARFCPECGSGAVTHRRAGCCAVGERRVKGSQLDHLCSGGEILNRGTAHKTGHTDPDGLETVAAWECLATCACGLSTLAPSGGAAPRCRCGRAMAWACAVARLDEQSGDAGMHSAGSKSAREKNTAPIGYGGSMVADSFRHGDTDQGAMASRFFNTFAPPDDVEPFFWQAKPSAAETEAGCEHLPTKRAHENVDREEGSAGLNSPRTGAGRLSGRKNHHPTKKGIEQMRHFCRLVTPPRGIVLDLFGGSGTTGCAAVLEGFRAILCEMEAEYVAIEEARIAFWERLAGTQVASEGTPKPKRADADDRQGRLF